MRWIDLLKVAALQIAFVLGSLAMDALRGQPFKSDAYLVSVGAVAAIALARTFTMAHNLSRAPADDE